MKKRTQSDELFERASKVVPGGIYGHVSPAAGLPRHFPHFCDHAQGSRFVDVDGNEWLDLCADSGRFFTAIIIPKSKKQRHYKEKRDQFSINPVH